VWAGAGYRDQGRMPCPGHGPRRCCPGAPRGQSRDVAVGRSGAATGHARRSRRLAPHPVCRVACRGPIPAQPRRGPLDGGARGVGGPGRPWFIAPGRRARGPHLRAGRPAHRPGGGGGGPQDGRTGHVPGDLGRRRRSPPRAPWVRPASRRPTQPAACRVGTAYRPASREDGRKGRLCWGRDGR
jgi:hypothetical protein